MPPTGLTGAVSRLFRWIAAGAVAGTIGSTLLVTAPASRAADAGLPDVSVLNPPAFGFQVGDVAQRRLRIHLPPGARFDATSLPPPTRQGAALELGSVGHDGPADAAEQTVTLKYQIFRSPPAPAVVEMPPVLLRFNVPAPGTGTGRREMTVRVEAHPLMVSPLAPADPPNRAGLGPMQPDQPAPPIEVDGVQTRLAAWLTLVGIGGAWLVWRHAIQPAWRRQQRPFASAWRELRHTLPTAAQDVDEATLVAATRRLHAALRSDAGRVLLAADLPAWLAARPRYAALQEPLMAFHQRSSLRFFAPGALQADAAAMNGQAAKSDASVTLQQGRGPSDAAAHARAQDAAALRALSQALARAEAAP